MDVFGWRCLFVYFVCGGKAIVVTAMEIMGEVNAVAKNINNKFKLDGRTVGCGDGDNGIIGCPRISH